MAEYTESKSVEVTMKEQEECKMIMERQGLMESYRANFETNWQECFDHIVPRKGEINVTRTPGDKRGVELFDSTAIYANNLLSGALHSMLTNQTAPFFELKMEDDLLNKDEEVFNWLQDVSKILHAVINQSNFQTEIHELYIDLGAIGTAAMFMAENDEHIVHFGAKSMKEIYVKENNIGLIDIVHRKFTWSTRQIVQEFGKENVPPKLQRDYESGKECNYEIIHAVEPNQDGGQRFLSRYFLTEEKCKLSQGYFNEFPYVVPRWTKTTGEVYGRGPGMDLLPDIKMVNEMMKTTIQGAQMTVFPPYLVEDDGVIGRVRVSPGGMTVVRSGRENPVRSLHTDARIDFGYQVVEDVRSRIRMGFFNNQIQLNQGVEKTAYETSKIVEEQLRYMGPVLGRQNFEFLRPMVERVFGICSRRMDKGIPLIPEAPPQIKGKSFDVRYSSLVARAQRMSEGENISRWLSASSPIVNAVPSSLDVLNADAAVKFLGALYGVPHDIINNDRDIAKKRDASARAAAAAAQNVQAQQQADVVQKIGPTAVQAAQLASGGRR